MIERDESAPVAEPAPLPEHADGCAYYFADAADAESLCNCRGTSPRVIVEAGKPLPVSFSGLRAAGYEAAEPAPRDPPDPAPALMSAAPARDKLPAMLTITEHAAAAHRASTNSAAAWNALPDASKRAIEARLIYDFDYLAGGPGRAAGTIYAAGPTDPVPVAPGP